VRADQVTAAILVGGRARRLDGRSKPALVIGRQTIADRLLGAIRDAAISTVFMVGPWRGAVPSGVRHVPDLMGHVGPLGGVYSALLVASTPTVVVLAGDMPFVTGGLVRRLAAVANEVDAVVPRDDRWHPLAAGYRRAIAPHLKGRLDRHALRMVDALEGMRVDAVTADDLRGLDSSDGMLLMNVNSADDLQHAERHDRRHS
jgi:molybdenum cofactor guanylyltransferase